MYSLPESVLRPVHPDLNIIDIDRETFGVSLKKKPKAKPTQDLIIDSVKDFKEYQKKIPEPGLDGVEFKPHQ